MAVGLVCATVLVIGAALPAQSGAASSWSTPVQVIFSASGTATIDQHYSGNGGYCGTHDVITLTWVSSFNAEIDNGVLQIVTASNLGNLAAVGPGTMALTESGVCTLSPGGGSCSATLSPGQGYPSLTLSGEGPTHVEAQSLPSTLGFAGCGGYAQLPFAGSDVSVLEASLPGSTTGVTDIPAGTFGPTQDSYTAHVSSAQAPAQIASSCLGVGRHGSGNDSCSASMSWSGMIQVKPQGCGGPKIKTVLRQDLNTGQTRELDPSEWSSEGITSSEVQPGENIGSDGSNRKLIIEFDDETPGNFGSFWVIGPHQ